MSFEKLVEAVIFFVWIFIFFRGFLKKGGKKAPGPRQERQSPSTTPPELADLLSVIFDKGGAAEKEPVPEPQEEEQFPAYGTAEEAAYREEPAATQAEAEEVAELPRPDGAERKIFYPALDEISTQMEVSYSSAPGTRQTIKGVPINLDPAALVMAYEIVGSPRCRRPYRFRI